jgi:hypothetical protein
MRDSGAGDGSSPRSKRPRKGTSKAADDAAAPRREAGGATGEGTSTGRKKPAARKSAKTAAPADVASVTTAAPGATGRGTSAGVSGSAAVTPGDGQSHDPSEFKAVASAPARTEEVPLGVAREELTRDQPTDDVELRIRRRAYEIYLSRRGAPGDPMADWIAAEREVRERR